MLQTKTYVLLHNSDSGPIAFYCGEALDPAVRFRRHQQAAADPLNDKEAYRYLREHNIKTFWYEELDGVSEAEAVKELTLAGVKLFNSNSGIRSTVKKKKDHTFAKLNRQADERIERIERNARLYNEAQQYSKSEVVRQRITGAYPTLDELLGAEWHAGPAEYLSADVGKTAERCEYAKLGEISIFVAFKNKDRLLSVMARHRDGSECWLPKPTWYGPNAKRETLLRNLVAEMNSPYGGFTKSYAA